MGFAIIFFASWLITALFAVMKKKLSFIENSFVILFALIISINWSWFIYEEWKLVEISSQPLNHTAFLISRSITIPLIIVTTMNLLDAASSAVKSFMIILFSVFILALLVVISNYFNITNAIRWNFIYDILYLISLNLMTYFFLFYFRKLSQIEVKV